MKHHLAMRAMLLQARLELREKLLRLLCRVAPAPEPGDDFFLAGDVPLALRDMVVDHSDVGRGIGHGRAYHFDGISAIADAPRLTP
jgi:hypothetical protein